MTEELRIRGYKIQCIEYMQDDNGRAYALIVSHPDLHILWRYRDGKGREMNLQYWACASLDHFYNWVNYRR